MLLLAALQYIYSINVHSRFNNQIANISIKYREYQSTQHLYFKIINIKTYQKQTKNNIMSERSCESNGKIKKNTNTMPVPLLFGRGSNCTTCGNNPASHQWEECNNQSLMESWDHNCQYHISDLQSNENHYRNRLRQRCID